MKQINLNTKIAAILKQHPDALEAIISISPKFEKLRNPILRKLMAGRASIAMASKMSGCAVNDFFAKLIPLGFEVDKAIVTEEKDEIQVVPEFFRNLSQKQIVELDVRPLIENGTDPLNVILKKVKNVHPGQVLKIINSFKPTPLILLLEKQGFESYADVRHDKLVFTYFFKKSETVSDKTAISADANTGWDEWLHRFAGKLQTVDVRELEMPLPMITILDALDKLPDNKALFVYHKRIPVFLLPELTERKFGYRIKEIADGEVHLLIFNA